MSATAGRLSPRDGLRVASVGLRARPLRAALSALGIAIGTAAIVAVLGLSSSSQAGLLAEIDRLGTNLLTVEAGQSLTGGAAKLPLEAPGRITLLDNVQLLAHTGLMKDEKVYRSSLIPVANSGGLQVRATSLNLLSVLNTGVARGSWLNAGTAREPVAVLGSVAAQRLGIDRVHPDQRIWLGGQWFNVAGILEPSPLATDIDTSALVGYPAAQRYLGYVSVVRGEQKAGPPSTIYVRTATGHEAAVQALLAPTANPEAPNEVNVSQPSDVLTARAAAAGAFDSLFLGLGVVALIVGAVGVANIMIISVLERRSEIGLRRALGATKAQIRTQFLTESILLAVIGGIVGVLAGIRGNGHVRQLEELGRRDPRRGVVGRHRLGHPDRRVRRPDAGRSSVSDAAHRGIANGMSGKWISIDAARPGQTKWAYRRRTGESQLASSYCSRGPSAGRRGSRCGVAVARPAAVRGSPRPSAQSSVALRGRARPESARRGRAGTRAIGADGPQHARDARCAAWPHASAGHQHAAAARRRGRLEPAVVVKGVARRGAIVLKASGHGELPVCGMAPASTDHSHVGCRGAGRA